MSAITRIPACTVSYCPAPTSPEWHVCWICGALATEHHHVRPRGMGGSKSRKKDPKNIVALCHRHHEMVTTGSWGCTINHVPGRGLVFWAWDLHGKTQAERILEAESSAAEAATNSEAHAEHRTAHDGSLAAPPPVSRAESSAAETSEPASFSLGPTQDVSAAPPPVLTHEERMEIARAIYTKQKRRQWEAGDTANDWERELGEEAWQYLDEFGYTHPSLSNIMHVCEKVPLSRRNEALDFSHHAVIYTLNAEDQEAWLDRAVDEGWNVREFREQVKGKKPPSILECPKCGYEGSREEFRLQERQ